jgi:hypothetical protein
MKTSLPLLLSSLAFAVAAVPARGAVEAIPIEASLAGSPEGAALELVSLTGPEQRLPFSPELKVRAPEAGFWRVVARAPGSGPAALDLLPLVDPAAIPPPPLVPARRIGARVTDLAGSPLPASVRVEALPRQGTDELAWAPASVEGLSGQDGSIHLKVAPSVPLLLTAAAPGFVTQRLEIAPQNADEILVRLTPGVLRSLAVSDGDGKPVADVTVATAGGLRLGTTDKNGRLAVTVPRGEDAGLRLTAPDCRWLRASLKHDSPDALSVTLEPPRTVKGQVVDRQTRQPIAGAWVWADGLPSCSVRTGADGRYSATLPGFEEPRLRAAAAGHRPEAIALGSAPTAPLLALTAIETRTATGRVVDLKDRPISGAEVLLMPSSSPETLGGSEALQATLRAETDSQGHFRIGPLGKGPFDLQAWARGFLTTRVRQVAIPPGKGSADLGVISLQAGSTLQGRLIDPKGNPVAGANVQATPSSGLSPGDFPPDGQASGREAVTDADGAFSLSGFRDGELLTLRFARRGFSTRTLTRIETPLAEPLTVELTPAARIAGTVLDEAGNPITGAKLLLAEDRQQGAGAARGRLVAAAETGSEGRFELEDLAPGRFRLSALAPGFLPETRAGLTLTAGSAIDGIEIVVLRGATLEGRVLTPDGSPAAGARVIVLDQPAEAGLGLAGRPETLADSEGHYQLGGLSKGDRKVHAGLPEFQPARRQIQVQEGVNQLDLRLGKGFEVSGRVSGPEGPVAGAALRLLPLDTTEAPSSAASGPDGAFRFKAVAAGRYRVQTEKPGYASDADEIQIAGTSVTGLDIRLKRGSAIAGRILGLDFQDLSEVQIVATSSDDRPGQAGQIAYEGHYRIEGLGPGEWKVIATLPSQGRQAGGQISLDDSQPEARLDLEFAAGFALSGRVELGGSPVGGALILVEAGDGSGGNAVTGPDGRFRVDGLRPGAYSLTALDPRSNLRSDQRLEIEGDRDVLVALSEAPKPAAPQR